MSDQIQPPEPPITPGTSEEKSKKFLKDATSWVDTSMYTPKGEQPPVGKLEIPDLGESLGNVGRDLKEFGRRNHMTGYQWYILLAVLFSVWVGANGTGGFSVIGAIFIFMILWVIALPFRSAAWVVNRLNSRPCAVCGTRMRTGESVCQACGTDFRVE